MTEKQNAKNSEEQEKLKKQGEKAGFEEEIKNMPAGEIRKKLSNKNSDYIFRLQKALHDDGMSDEEASKKIDELLPEMYSAQIKGQPANVLYGASPTVMAQRITHPAVKPTNVPDGLMIADGSLIYIAILTVLFGIMQLFTTSKQNSGGSGILTMIVMGIAMGWFFTKYNTWLAPDEKTGKTSWRKVILGGFGSLIVIMLIVWALSAKALQPVNPVLPGWADILVAAIAYGLRYLMRRYYGIKGSSFNPSSMTMTKKKNK